MKLIILKIFINLYDFFILFKYLDIIFALAENYIKKFVNMKRNGT